MKIRSITYFLNPGYPPAQAALYQAGEFRAAAKPAFEAAGYEVESCRMATVPFPALLDKAGISEAANLAKTLEEAAQKQGYDYISLGPALPDRPETYTAIPGMLAATQNAFFSGILSNLEKGVSLPAVRLCAQVIAEASRISPDGFANLRFAALANVPAGSPFFPAAYHARGGPRFALATEAAGLVVDAFTGAPSLAEARRRLVQAVEKNARLLTSIAGKLNAQWGVQFGGIDFSPAPFPEVSHSLGAALERLGIPALGQFGSVAAAAILASTLDAAAFPRTGFSGLMLPVLEDATLADRAADGSLSVKDLLLFSAVCGAGLDTVPLPGDASPQQLAAVLLDLAALAQRLDKPLTARLMPIPGKQAGDATSFDFSYFANSRVMSLPPAQLAGYLLGDESFDLPPRHKK